MSCPLDPTRLVDGHNCYEIYTRVGIEFTTVEGENCPTREAAITWIAANQLGQWKLTAS